MIKIAMGNVILNANNEVEKNKHMDELKKLIFYVHKMDQRNMGVFPENDVYGNSCYIPSDSFFMMGDNRYNSLDMRHSYESYTKQLTDKDLYSVTYESNLKPQYVNKKSILGKASFRFWPLNRAGFTGK